MVRILVTTLGSRIEKFGSANPREAALCHGGAGVAGVWAARQLSPRPGQHPISHALAATQRMEGVSGGEEGRGGGGPLGEARVSGRREATLRRDGWLNTLKARIIQRRRRPQVAAASPYRSLGPHPALLPRG